MRFALITTASIACGLLLGCSEGSVTTETTTDVKTRILEQLSAGGGIAGYDFYVDSNGSGTMDPGERVGALLVTNGAFDASAGYYDETEYWRWEPGSLDAIRAGGVDISVDFHGTSGTYDPNIVANFEDAGYNATTGSTDWQAWEVNRAFELDTSFHFVYSSPGMGAGQGVIVYRLEADAPEGVEGTITYFHVMDFTDELGYPRMTWLIPPGDAIKLWQAMQANDADVTGMYEVRLTSDTVFEEMPYGWGAELSTLK